MLVERISTRERLSEVWKGAMVARERREVGGEVKEEDRGRKEAGDGRAERRPKMSRKAKQVLFLTTDVRRIDNVLIYKGAAEVYIK